VSVDAVVGHDEAFLVGRGGVAGGLLVGVADDVAVAARVDVGREQRGLVGQFAVLDSRRGDVAPEPGDGATAGDGEQCDDRASDQSLHSTSWRHYRIKNLPN
jgi:hypothetical protein